MVLPVMKVKVLPPDDELVLVPVLGVEVEVVGVDVDVEGVEVDVAVAVTGLAPLDLWLGMRV